MTIRQLFYRLVVLGAIPKTEAAYKTIVVRLLTEMRLSGAIPFEWIVDTSRTTHQTETYYNVADALDAATRFYRRSALRQAADYV